MSRLLDRTHDINLQSWLPAAHLEGADFLIQNLPFCVFHRIGTHDTLRCRHRRIRDVGRVGLFEGIAAIAAAVCTTPQINSLKELGAGAATVLRAGLAAGQTRHREALSPHRLW